MSIVEIYNETLRDLLVKSKDNASLKITSDEVRANPASVVCMTKSTGSCSKLGRFHRRICLWWQEGNTDIQGLTREKVPFAYADILSCAGKCVSATPHSPDDRVQVLNEDEVQRLLARGASIRQTAGHDANATSSRSHLIFTIYCQATMHTHSLTRAHMEDYSERRLADTHVFN